jgi:type VI secretion system secreted protein Hcp
MPMPSYMKISDFPGSVAVSGREETVEVLSFSHEVYIPVDHKTGKYVGNRVHGQLKIVKNFDKASPKLYNYLCDGRRIPEVIITWYERDEETGAEKEFYVHKMENAKVVKVHALMDDVDDQSKEHYSPREEISFQYDKLTWTYLDGQIEYSDSYMENR